MPPCDLASEEGDRVPIYVSILVLVDAALRPKNWNVYDAMSDVFQSLF